MTSPRVVSTCTFSSLKMWGMHELSSKGKVEPRRLLWCPQTCPLVSPDVSFGVPRRVLWCPQKCPLVSPEVQNNKACQMLFFFTNRLPLLLKIVSCHSQIHVQAQLFTLLPPSSSFLLHFFLLVSASDCCSVTSHRSYRPAPPVCFWGAC